MTASQLSPADRLAASPVRRTPTRGGFGIRDLDRPQHRPTTAAEREATLREWREYEDRGQRAADFYRRLREREES